MKLIITKILLLSLFLSYFQFSFADNLEEVVLKKFIVTAYYSPLPNQNFYLRGNYEDEIILNGEGKWGASGKQVYSGMLAAPKTYKFGTKIYLDGIGIGTVDDRGGAIVGSGSRGYDGDRLDIWMGYGDDGLNRALTWGKRVVYGRVLSSGEQDLPFIAVDNFKIGKIDFQSLKNAQLVGKNTSKNNQIISKYIVPSQIGTSTNFDTIKYFQTILKNLGYYSGDIDGKYSSKIDEAVFNFQLANDIVKSNKDKGAGYYGPKTKEVLNTKYLSFLNQEKIRLAKEKQIKDEIAYIDSQVEKLIKSLGIPKENEVGNHVRKLQKILKILGFFEYKDTAIYGRITKESILKYQIKSGLVNSAGDKGAGLIGEKTLAKLQSDIREMIIVNKNLLKELSF